MPIFIQDVIWVKARQSGESIEQLVEAGVCGDLAIHESIDQDHEWTVTHIPTGLSLHTGLTHLQAASLAEELGKLDWNSTNPSLLSQRNSQSARAAFRKVLGEK